MPRMRMKMDCPVSGYRRKVGALVDVDAATARALVHLRIAEIEEPPQTYERGDMTAESLDIPTVPKKRAYKRRDMKAK